MNPVNKPRTGEVCICRQQVGACICQLSRRRTAGPGNRAVLGASLREPQLTRLGDIGAMIRFGQEPSAI